MVKNSVLNILNLSYTTAASLVADESKRWRHPGFIERSSDQDVQCLWPSGWMVSGSRTMSLFFFWLEAYIMTLAWIMVLHSTYHSTPGHSKQSYYLGCSFWVWMLKPDEKKVLELHISCDVSKSLCLMPAGLASTWRITRGAALNLRCSLWFDAKIVRLMCFCAWNPGNWDSISPPSTTIALAWCFDLRLMQCFSTETTRGSQDRCGHGTCRR